MSDPAAFSPTPLSNAQGHTPAWLSFLEGDAPAKGGFMPDLRFVATLDSVPELAAEPEVDNQDALLAEAFERGLAQGHAESLALAEAETSERRKLGIALRGLESEMRDHFAAMLAETVKALCEASFAPLALDTTLLQTRCERAAAMLEEAQETINLRLSPQDIARLDPEFLASWTIAPDPDLPQGELRAEGRDGAVLDGPREWARALAEALETC